MSLNVPKRIKALRKRIKGIKVLKKIQVSTLMS